jgi:hypothetical protein
MKIVLSSLKYGPVQIIKFYDNVCHSEGLRNNPTCAHLTKKKWLVQKYIRKSEIKVILLQRMTHRFFSIIINDLYLHTSVKARNETPDTRLSK